MCEFMSTYSPASWVFGGLIALNFIAVCALCAAQVKLWLAKRRFHSR